MHWFKRHKITVFIVGLFAGLGIVLAISYSLAGENTAVGRVSQGIVNTVSKPFVAAASFVENRKTDVSDLLSLREDNERLKKENARLRSELNDIKLLRRDLEELRELSSLLEFESISSEHDVVAANIVAIDRSNNFSMFTIDKGSADGIERGMTVASADGLVGTVYESGDKHSKVVSLIEQTQNVSFSLMRDMALVGIVHGNGSGELEGFMLDSTANVAVGDKIVTSQLGRYPLGIEIGKVKSVHYDKDTRLKTLVVDPSVNFNRLQKVAVFR